MSLPPTKSEKIKDFIKYGAGLKLFSLFTNYLFYKIFKLEVAKAYIFVLSLDFALAFILNYYYVFKVKNSNIYPVIVKFLIAGLVFRIFDLKLYLFVVGQIKNIFISQLLTTAIIFILKFVLYDKIFKSNKKKEL
tara:strand:+ start:5818 stop:6222 length:405 start_codon:yes stop_codon:yes gene_type:complete